MAAVTTQEKEASSSSSSTDRHTYHVFLSFRGKDTRKTFCDHLYTALLSAGIRTFRDDDELDRGENIKSELHRAIHQSRMSIIVFSKDYASSGWCLDELVMILQWKRTSGHMILPVFYDVDPYQVMNQTAESFEEAFARHQEQQQQLKVEEWRAALGEVSDFEDRMVLQDQPANGLESKFIQEIVKKVGRKLNRTILRVAPYPIGIDSRVENINLWLQDGSNNVGILAIYGIGGIGKTTIAKTVYNLNFDKFDSSSFLVNIKEASEQPNGLVRLQKQLLSDILKKKMKKIYNVAEGIMKIKNAICCKRVLLVLDDVDDLDQLNAVLGMREWFYPGSKIIITTRHERLLKAHEACEMYKVKALDDKESLQLFSWHSFGRGHPTEDYTELSRNIVYHCQGIPLALQVLGSSLSGRSVDIWESALKKLKAIPDHQILKILRISYDSLSDDHDKNLFLDISCFFVGKDKDYVVMILDCDFFPIVGIQNLIDRCLLKIDDKNKLMMHQLLQDMGREIIRQESPQKPGQRSRVCHHKDSFNVLKEKTGTETIKGLILDMRMLKEVKSAGTLVNVNAAKQCSSAETIDELLLANPGYSVKRRRLSFSKHSINADSKSSNDVAFETDAFARMQKLRLLQLSYVQLTGCYEKFPKKLRWLYWRGFHLKSIPDDFPLESLVALEIRNSSLRQVWKGTKFLGLLKILNFSHSHGLIRTPDFSGLPNLKILILKDCIRLVELHESIGELERLMFLNLRGCKNLRKLPKEIGKLKSLEKLIISGCSKLTELPMELGELEFLTMFHADEIAINQVASDSGQVKSWHAQFWSWLSKARKWQQSIIFPLGSLSRSLVSLSLANCNLSDDAIPINLSSMSLLQYLNLSGNPICSLPENIKGLRMLKDLWLDSCTRLQSLPELPLSLIDLKTIDCTSLERITNLPNLLKSLFLDIRGCEKLVEVLGLFKLEPIGNFDAELIKNLGFLNLESIGNTEVELFNKLTETRKTGPVQGLYEFGIFTTYLPGSVVPDCFSNKSTESSMSFNVPSHPNTKIRGLNVSIIYGRSNDKRYRYWSNDKFGNWHAFYVKVCNKTKGLKFVYSPTFIGIPGAKEDMILLSHWEFGNQLEAGNEVSVSVIRWSNTFQMKEFAISLVYDKHEGETDIETNYEEEKQIVHRDPTYPSYQSVIDLDVAYQLRAHEYFLSNSEYYVLKKRSSDDGVRTVLFENLFEDSVRTTGSTQEGEVREESESDYDFTDISDGEVEKEVEELLAAAAAEWWH